jgi:RNA polymerase-binding transcription factor DksA
MDDAAVPAALAELREEVARRVAALRRQLDELADEQALTTHDDEHDPEGVTIAYQREQLRSLLAGARAEQAAIDLAERRHREGRYGRCDRCGAVIGAERLAALPAAAHCLDCAGRVRRR